MDGKLVVVMTVICLAAVGCASAKVDYFPPSNLETPENELTVSEPFEKIWDRMVKNLSADFFVINNIEKASRLINVSFSSDQPSRYVNCGRSKRVFTGAAGTQVYQYETANSAVYAWVDSQGRPFNVKRKTNLEGRSNIYIAPEEGKTVVSVNTRYILNVNVKMFRSTGQFVGDDQYNYVFNTKQIFERPEPQFNVIVKCVATGILEERILNAAKKGGE